MQGHSSAKGVDMSTLPSDHPSVLLPHSRPPLLTSVLFFNCNVVTVNEEVRSRLYLQPLPPTTLQPPPTHHHPYIHTCDVKRIQLYRA